MTRKSTELLEKLFSDTRENILEKELYESEYIWDDNHVISLNKLMRSQSEKPFFNFSDTNTVVDGA